MAIGAWALPQQEDGERGSEKEMTAADLVNAELERQRAEHAITVDRGDKVDMNGKLMWRIQYRCGHTFDKPVFNVVGDWLCPTCSWPEPTATIGLSEVYDER